MRTHHYVGNGPYCERCNAPAGKSRIHAVENLAPDDLERDDEERFIDQVLQRMVDRGEPFTLNDCRHQLAPVTRKNLIGKRVLAFAKAGLIVDMKDDKPSTDRGTHGHQIRTWRPKIRKEARK